MAEEMKKMIEQAAKYVQPGELHKKLADYVGKWDCITTMTMGPGAATPVGKSTAEISWLMEGRWLKQEAKGSFMNMPYHAFGLLGHDNFKQSFVSSWIDNQNTFKLDAEGRLLQDGKTLMNGGIPHLIRGGFKEGFIKMSPYGPAVSDAAKADADAAKAAFMAGPLEVFTGELKDNDGKVQVPAGSALKRDDPAIESMSWLVEGVLGSTK